MRARLGHLQSTPIIAALCFAIPGCKPAPKSDPQPPVSDIAAGEEFPVPTDTNAKHRLLEWRLLPNGHREALTRRDGGASGTSFALVEIDCGELNYRPLGQGDTEAEARERYAEPGAMLPVVPGSIQSFKRDYVCQKELTDPRS